MAHEWWHWGDDEWDDFGADDMGWGYDPKDSPTYTTPEEYRVSQEIDYFGEEQTYDSSSFLEYEPYQPEVQTYSSPEGTFGSYGGEFGGTISEFEYYKEQSEQLQDDPPEEEQSYPELARNFINQLAPWLGKAAKIKSFATKMSAKRKQQGGGAGGGGRQIQAPYTTNRAGTSGRIQADIQSSFRGRDSRQLMAMLSQQSRQAASGVQIVANKAADVGEKIKGNDLYDLISGETKPLGAKQQLPTGQSFRSLSIRRTQRA